MANINDLNANPPILNLKLYEGSNTELDVYLMDENGKIRTVIEGDFHLKINKPDGSQFLIQGLGDGIEVSNCGTIATITFDHEDFEELKQGGFLRMFFSVIFNDVPTTLFIGNLSMKKTGDKIEGVGKDFVCNGSVTVQMVRNVVEIHIAKKEVW